ncbi:MAG: DMT family transporter, partial [Anaerolineae bacterium]|nr:DMT family transporter [Anaerolineae bacterium]
LFWALTSIFFTRAGQRIGSQSVNRVRLLLATGMLSIIHLGVEGQLVPVHTDITQWGWLSLSAIVGLVIGDGLLFYAFTQIGSRLSMLLMALSPVIGALLAWVFLGERLAPLDLLAILITVSGVAWVVIERPPNGAARRDHAARVTGVVCGLGAALSQAAGLVMSKEGMRGGVPALPASLIRVAAATVAIWILALLQRDARTSIGALKDRRAARSLLIGTLVGPVAGMTLSLWAVRLSDVGIASTLMALSPILLLPLGYWIFGERVTYRAVFGTLIAMSGVAMIFLT